MKTTLLMKTILTVSLLFMMNTFSFAQKVYVNNQNSQIYGLCLACSIQNPQNAVGDNENDYSSLQIPIGAIARLEQTLIFPTVTKQNKIIIGIGTGQAALSVQLLGGVAIETFNGNVSNNDYQIVNNDLLKLGVSNPNRGTIETFISKPYDRIRVTLNSGLLNLNGGLRIYYAYHKPEACIYPPFDPLHYYSFNGNINDVANGYNMTSTATPVFQNNMPCGQGLGTTMSIPKYSLKAGYKRQNGKTSKDLALNQTVAFWAKTEQKQSGSKSPSVVVEPILDKLLVLPDSLKLGVSSEYPNFGLVDNLDFSWMLNTATSFDHYVITTENGLIHVWKNGILAPQCKQPNGWYDFYLDLSTLDAIINLVGENDDVSNIITLDRSQIDEFVVYDKVLTPEEIQILYQSYNKTFHYDVCPTTSNATMRATPTDELFTVSPNPTTGQITFDGNMLLLDAEISVSNLSGKEVYHSKLTTKTFDLPSTLPGGVYMLSLQTKEGKIYTRKIMVTR